MDLKNQKRMAAELLGCGYNRVWIDPNRMEDVATAITRGNIRVLINAGAIRAKPKRGISSGRAKSQRAQKAKGRQRGPGSRKGAKYARTPRKQAWMKRIRILRAKLKDMRDAGEIDTRTYRKYYRQAKGGMFRDRSHLETQMRIHGVIKEEGEDD